MVGVPYPLYASSGQLTSTARNTVRIEPANGPTAIVARITFRSFTELQRLTTLVDVWEVHHDGVTGHGTVVALLPSAVAETLRDSGYRMEVDAIKSALLTWQPVVSARQSGGIPGFSLLSDGRRDLCHVTNTGS